MRDAFGHVVRNPCEPAVRVGPVIAAGIAAPWFVQQTLLHGQAFIDGYWFMNVTLRRYAVNAVSAGTPSSASLYM